LSLNFAVTLKKLYDLQTSKEFYSPRIFSRHVRFLPNQELSASSFRIHSESTISKYLVSMKTFFTRLLNVPANLQPGLLVMICTLLTTFSVFGQFNYSDNAGNYGGTWPNGSNFGTGYNAWTISSTGGNAGTFIGNPASNGMGTAGIGTTAHGLFGHSGNTVNAIRFFGAGGTNVPMQIGDVFSFHWAMNWDAGGGFKGFDLRADGTTIFNVNNGGSATITTTNGNANTVYGTDAMLVTLTRINWTQYTFTMTSRSGGAPLHRRRLSRRRRRKGVSRSRLMGAPRAHLNLCTGRAAPVTGAVTRQELSRSRLLRDNSCGQSVTVPAAPVDAQ
jgi:hypothetical protein